MDFPWVLDGFMEELAVQLDELENAKLVQRAADEDAAYIFNHALAQEAAYESLLVKKRREIHRRVAEAYERLYAGRLDEFASLLAQHWSQAGDDAKTVEYALCAADSASRLNAVTVTRLYYASTSEKLLTFPCYMLELLKSRV